MPCLTTSSSALCSAVVSHPIVLQRRTSPPVERHNGASISRFNNVELHRPTVRSPVQSNSINTRSRKYARQQCRTPSTVEIPTDNNVELHRLSDADPSCVQFRDSSRTIRHGESNLQRGLVLRAIERKSKTNLVKKSNYTVRT